LDAINSTRTGAAMALGEEIPKIRAAAVTKGKVWKQRATRHPREVEGFISQVKIWDN
jgi:hypothetical protein